MSSWNFTKNPKLLKRFLKAHKKRYLKELGYSLHLKKWKRVHRRQLLELNYLPVINNHIIYMVKTLEEDFIIPRKKALKIAIGLYKEKWDYIKSYMIKRLGIGLITNLPKHSREQAFREQKARGFKKKFKPNRELPYIKSNINYKYIWPKQYKLKDNLNMGGIYEKFGNIGVSGHTSIVLPKRLLNR